MGAIYFDRELSDDQRRAALYDGALLVYSPRATTSAFCAFARQMIDEAFAPWLPEEAHLHLPVERYAEILAALKPAFIHHPESKRLISDMVIDFGCDPERVYFDVPRLRSSTPGGYLTTGIAYAFHPHRDTWYSAPRCQLNWWLPVNELTNDNGIGFHPQYWTRPIKNGSRHYNYAEWNRASRFDAAKHIGSDTRVQPKAEEEFDWADETRPLCSPGGLILFSGAQMHSSVENTTTRTRFSVDFRTVHLSEVEAGEGAHNIDSECTGTTMGDYLRCSDLSHIPQELIDRYDRGFGRVVAD
ncbi:MAG: hypothetical protein E6J87_22570 [Deltaproteobacteria bacterium]|nr:MAG: hypothetical protein E6J87_22570 [Deltaproteobacteria bacterium]